MIKKILPLLTALIFCICIAGCVTTADSSASEESAPMSADSVGSDISADDEVSPAEDLTAEDGAKTARQAVSVYLFDCDVTGDKAAEKKVLAERFTAACSDDGLDLGAGRPDDKGDRLIYDTMRRAGYSAGRIYVETAEDGYAVRCTLPDGATAVYPQQ